MMVVMAGSIFSFLKKRGLSSSDICSSAASSQVVSAGVNFSQILIKTQVLLQVLVFGGWGHLTLELSGDFFSDHVAAGIDCRAGAGEGILQSMGAGEVEKWVPRWCVSSDIRVENKNYGKTRLQ